MSAPTSPVKERRAREAAAMAQKQREHADVVRARAEARANEERERMRSKAAEKEARISALAERREREGAYASATGAVVTSVETRSNARARGRGGGGGGGKPAWVSPTAEAEGTESATRAYAASIVANVIERCTEAEREEAVRACVKTAVERVIAAHGTAAAEVRVAGAARAPPPPTTPVNKKLGIIESTSSSPSTPKPKSAMEVKLAERLTEARETAAAMHADLVKSPLRAPFKDRMRAGKKENPLQRLRGAALRLFKRTSHDLRRRAEIIKEKHSREAALALALAALLLARRGGAPSARPRSRA